MDGPCFLRRYATLIASPYDLLLPVLKAGASDFAVGADWSPVAGDVKVRKDGAIANITNLPTVVVIGNGALWSFVLTAAELTCKKIEVLVCDAVTKSVQDTLFIVETFGDAAAMFPEDVAAAMWAVNMQQINSSSQAADRLQRACEGIITGTVDAGASVTSIPALTIDPAITVTDQFNGLILCFDRDTATSSLRGQKTPIVGVDLPNIIRVTALTNSPQSGDKFTIS